MNDKRVAIIMAGGSGERFWPLSRRNHPKQLLKLGDPDASLLAEAVQRIIPAFPAEHIFVATGRHLQDAIRKAGLGIPEENVIAEPCKRNTAGCLCYAAATIGARFGVDAPATMAVLTADQRIDPANVFRDTIASAMGAAEQNEALVTIGVRPTRPETGYGYIEMDDASPAADGSAAEYPTYPVVRFLEKPDERTAQRFVENANYLWNSGMFFWRLPVFLRKLADTRPEMAVAVREMAEAIAAGDIETVERIFAGLPNISIDYALMERTKGILVTPADFRWDDLGAWDALDRTFSRDNDGNVAVGDPVLVNTSDSIVYNDAGPDAMAVSVVGMNEVVVVVTADAVLVVPKEQAQDVKAAVAALKERNARQL